jgi:hypothetical protein
MFGHMTGTACGTSETTGKSPGTTVEPDAITGEPTVTTSLDDSPTWAAVAFPTTRGTLERTCTRCSSLDRIDLGGVALRFTEGVGLLGDGDPDPVDSSSISSSTAAVDDDIDVVIGGRSTPVCSGSLLEVAMLVVDSRFFELVFAAPSNSSSSGVT